MSGSIDSWIDSSDGFRQRVALPLSAQEPIPLASSVMPPGYIQQMPTVERVLSDMKVADSVDTRARQYVAVSDLGHILFVLTWDRGVVRTSDNHTRSGLTPEETRLERGYRDASNRLLLGSGGGLAWMP